jgi:hypothetical protein
MRSDETKTRAEEDRTTPGLCARCQFHRTQRSSRGSVFHRCERAESDPSFARYPPLPVLRCRGFELAGEGDAS